MWDAPSVVRTVRGLLRDPVFEQTDKVDISREKLGSCLAVLDNVEEKDVNDNNRIASASTV